jgi:sRNA-binding carbon storage regulator CsrA
MLVLNRKAGEELLLGEPGNVLTGPIVVKVVEQDGCRVRLGVTCGNHIAINRAEVSTDKQKTNRPLVGSLNSLQDSFKAALEENATLRQRIADLESQLKTLIQQD